MNTAETTTEPPKIRRFPEAPRPRPLTVVPKSTRRCIWRAIKRSEDRLVGLAMAAVAIDRAPH